MRTLPAVGDWRVEPEEQPDDEQRGEDDPGQETGNPGRKQTCHTNLCHVTGNVYTVLWICIGFNADPNSDPLFQVNADPRVIFQLKKARIFVIKTLYLRIPWPPPVLGIRFRVFLGLPDSDPDP
jgi:hypothetical protein